MPERVPTDHFALHTCANECRPNDLPQHHVWGQRFLSVQPFGRKKEIPFPAVCRDQSPTQKHVIDEPVERHWLPACFCLHLPNLPRTHDRVTATSNFWKSTSLHLSANSSERRKPVVPASITITCSRNESSSSNDWNSAGVRTSGSRSSFAEQRTLLIGLNVNHSCLSLAEDRRHDVPYLRLGGRRKGQRFEPLQQRFSHRTACRLPTSASHSY